MKRSRLFIDFYYCGAGWIAFRITYNETKLIYEYSYIYGSPKDMIHWAEEIFKGNYYMYTSDEEGVEWFFDYDGNFFSVGDNKYDDKKNPYGNWVTRLKVRISQNELCKIIYKAIKRFQKSGLYEPSEWEAITFEEFLLTMFKTTEEAVSYMAKRSMNQITYCFDKKYKGHFNYYDFTFFEQEPYDYDLANTEKRKEIIHNYINRFNYMGYGGWSVMKIHSPLLERII